MASKFDENKQFLSADRHFMISTSHEYKLLEHQWVQYFEDISNLKVCSQELKRRLEEKEKELLKEKLKILEERSLVIQQDNILEDMQTKLSHLEEQLQQPELIGLKISKQLLNQIELLGAGSSQQGEKVSHCPSSPAQKTATVKPALKSMTSSLKKFCLDLGNSLWLFGRLLLRFGCLCIILALLCKCVLNTTCMDLQVQRISKLYYETCLWTH